REIRHIQLLHYGSTLFHAGSLFAPLLLTPEGPIKDSSDILAFVDRMAETRHTLFPADPAQREKVLARDELFDTTVGGERPRWMYHVGFRELGVDKMVEFAAQGVPSWQPPLVKLLVAPAKAYLNARLDISDDTVNAGLARLNDVFDRVGSVL